MASGKPDNFRLHTPAVITVKFTKICSYGGNKSRVQIDFKNMPHSFNAINSNVVTKELRLRYGAVHLNKPVLVNNKPQHIPAFIPSEQVVEYIVKL
jgi:hypothetical protein